MIWIVGHCKVFPHIQQRRYINKKVKERERNTPSMNFFAIISKFKLRLKICKM